MIKSKSIKVSTPNGFAFVEKNQICYIAALNKGSLLKLINSEEVYSIKPLKEFDRILEEPFFLRIHRSMIINLVNISEYKAHRNEITMKCGECVCVSYRKKTEFVKVLSGL
jgi:DNA-binding LytR/AlgR family response regulator